MTTELLREGVLNDSVIHYPSEGKVFKGGYIAIVEQYNFSNEWSNRQEVKRFRNENRLNKFLDKNYPNY